MKIGLTPQAGVLPEMALVPQMTVPTGSNAFTDGEVLPGINWLYSWDITERVSTGGSTQFNRDVDPETDRTHLEGAQSWTVGYSVTDRLGSFAEWFVLFPSGAETVPTRHFADCGLTYLINDDLQWDVRYGRRINGAGDDYFVGTGLSIRFQ